MLRKIIIATLLFSWLIQPDFAIAITKKHHTHRIKHTKKKSPRIKRNRVSRPTHAIHTSHLTRTTVNTPNIQYSFFPSYLLTSMEKNLVKFVRNTVESIHYTTYKLGGTRIEPSKGIYIVDCSSYVDHILKTIYPRSYNSLAIWSGTSKPTTNDFYQYFQNLGDNSAHWNSIDDAEDLRPGDILVFRSKNRMGIETGGHVMIIMDKPVRNGNELLLRIADSAPSGHSSDTRLLHRSGIGIGSMLLKINPHTLRPYAYAWTVDSRWETNVNFAMARPVDMG